jgi:hypothetical protein
VLLFTAPDISALAKQSVENLGGALDLGVVPALRKVRINHGVMIDAVLSSAELQDMSLTSIVDSRFDTNTLALK